MHALHAPAPGAASLGARPARAPRSSRGALRPQAAAQTPATHAAKPSWAGAALGRARRRSALERAAAARRTPHACWLAPPGPCPPHPLPALPRLPALQATTCCRAW